MQILKDFRLETGLTQRELGVRMGVTQQAVSLLEARTPEIAATVRYLDACGAKMELNVDFGHGNVWLVPV